MSKPKTKKKAAPKAKKATKLPLTVTVRLDAAPRQKLRDISERDGVSENALIQQLVDRYLDKLDLGPRVDSIETRVARIEGALFQNEPAGAAVDPDAEPDDVDPDETADPDDDDEDDDADDEDDVEDDDDDDDDDGGGDEDGPPSLLDKQEA